MGAYFITSKEGKVLEIRKIYDTKVLVRTEGFRTSSRYDKTYLNSILNEKDKIK